MALASVALRSAELCDAELHSVERCNAELHNAELQLPQKCTAAEVQKRW